MHRIIVAIATIALSLITFAKEVRDTVFTRQNDRIILSYNVSNNGTEIIIDPSSRPRIIPSENLKQACKGELDKLKVVAFDRIGDFGKVNWKGSTPTAFMIPAGFSYDKTSDGYYIWGECQPMTFRGNITSSTEVKMPLYIAIYEKKHNYRIVASSFKPLIINAKKLKNGVQKSPSLQKRSESERIAIHSTEEIEADNEDITQALSSIELINELLTRETELPFSMTLQAEINNLISLKGKIKEQEIIDRVNKVLLLCDAKEREIKESQNSSALAAEAQERALIEQQKQETAEQQRTAEEKARIQEEKQQKKTFWMIIGGIILAILAFIANAIFKHFRDIRNQKSIMQMQESLARQAEHEAGRRSREIIRNKAHQVANKGKSQLRESLQNSGKQRNNNKPRSI